MSITILVAYDDNRLIGNKTKLPWYIPGDLKRFKLITSRKDVRIIILVGPKTYKGIPNSVKLDKTRHFMVIKKKDIENKGMLLSYLRRIYDIIYVIGGQWLYENLLDDVDTIMATRVYGSYKGNKYFPNIRESEWKITSKSVIEYHSTSQKEAIAYRYITYVRVYEENQYIFNITDILNNGQSKGNTLSKFGTQMRFSLLNNKFPLITTKKMYLKGIIEELLWFIRGETDVRILRSKNVHIWDANTNRKRLNDMGFKDYDEYDAGPIYGFNFRHYGATYQGYEYKEHKGIDQLINAISMIKEERKRILEENYKPNRRIIINLWNPCQLNQVTLPACHMIYQFSLHKENKNIYLSCSMYQRSGDMGLGVPFNIASASLLTIIIAKYTDTLPFEFIHTIGDAHIYKEHIDAIKKQVQRCPYKSPTIELNIGDKDITDLKYEDFILRNYKYHKQIKMKLII